MKISKEWPFNLLNVIGYNYFDDLTDDDLRLKLEIAMLHNLTPAGNDYLILAYKYGKSVKDIAKCYDVKKSFVTKVIHGSLLSLESITVHIPYYKRIPTIDNSDEINEITSKLREKIKKKDRDIYDIEAKYNSLMGYQKQMQKARADFVDRRISNEVFTHSMEGITSRDVTFLRKAGYDTIADIVKAGDTIGDIKYVNKGKLIRILRQIIADLIDIYNQEGPDHHEAQNVKKVASACEAMYNVYGC